MAGLALELQLAFKRLMRAIWAREKMREKPGRAQAFITLINDRARRYEQEAMTRDE